MQNNTKGVNVKMEENAREHKVTIDNRARITVTAVEDVESFDEEKVIIITDMGTMTVTGTDFKISRLNVEDGQLIIEGEIDEIQYSERAVSDGGGFFSRLFR